MEGILIHTDNTPQRYRLRNFRMGVPGFCDYWYLLVKDYIDREITRESDKFAAITGLAKRTAELTVYTYIAGLWLEDMHKGLLWSSREFGRQSTTYTAPSWTWISLRNGGPDSGIYDGIYRLHKRDTSYDLVIHECKVFHIDDNIWSTCTGGYLIATGLWRTADPWPGSPLPHITIGPWLMGPILEFDLQRDCEPVEYIKAPICYLQVAKWWSYEEGGDSSVFTLILEPTGENDAEYRRIGRAEIPQFNFMAQEGWIRKTVMIV
ncbi:hypothetical protein BS50DRAFT_630887 [Corynespora cassiicola Philippines]|uniref:Heterokaryon incompatibility domain-containing protein n=1 Tax=Corynespora cassiicola Philippines TaxID=1448308 RepID=A0A2T2NZF6_CORCC|nr:hypothetical protein BS50DRAFT_630887 [Corynespora cassiicola Philippines]